MVVAVLYIKYDDMVAKEGYCADIDNLTADGTIPPAGISCRYLLE